MGEGETAVKKRIGLLLLAVLLLTLLLSSCQGDGDSVPYDSSDHTHVFGYWYDTVPVTCQSAGEHKRFCKICRAEEYEVVPVPEDKAAQNHRFSDTVVEPTEAEWGYTTRVCEDCAYVVEKANMRPPLYALLEGASTITAAQTGVDALLLSDTQTHTVWHLVGKDSVVNGDLARRFALSIVVVEALGDGAGQLNKSTPYVVRDAALSSVDTAGRQNSDLIYVGATLTVEQLLGLWLLNGGTDAAACLSDAVGESAATVLSKVNARVGQLGLTTAFSSLVASEGYGNTTLYDTAVLFARVLDEPLLVSLLTANTNPYLTVCGVKPVAYLKTATLRLSAIPTEEKGEYQFLLLAGTGIAGNTEEVLYKEIPKI